MGTSPSGSGLTRRRFVAAGFSMAVVAGLAGRVALVNSSACPMPAIVSHKMGSWVELDGAFLQSRSSEDTQGYAVCVCAADVMSRNAYVVRYASDGSETLEGMDVQSLVCLTLGIRNGGFSHGGIALPAMYLITAGRNEFLVPDTDLLLAAEPGLRENAAGGMGMSVRAGTEYEIHLAYRHQGGEVEVGGERSNEAYLSPVGETRFSLRVSNLPVRHEIEVTATA